MVNLLRGGSTWIAVQKQRLDLHPDAMHFKMSARQPGEKSWRKSSAFPITHLVPGLALSSSLHRMCAAIVWVWGLEEA